MNKSKNIVIVIVSFIVAMIFATADINGMFGKLEYMAEDMVYQKPSAIPNDVKIIAIDEKTLEMLGPYSDWNRRYFADVINHLNVDEDTKPSIIGMDIMFTGTNYSEGDDALVEAAKKYGNVILASSVSLDSYIYQDKDNNYYSPTKYQKYHFFYIHL